MKFEISNKIVIKQNCHRNKIVVCTQPNLLAHNVRYLPKQSAVKSEHLVTRAKLPSVTFATPRINHSHHTHLLKGAL